MTVTRAPVVGIVGYGHTVHRHFGELPVTGVPPAYVESVVAAGGRPVIVPPDGIDLLDVVDALVLTGGGDVDPARYGGPGPAEDVDPARDEAELAMARGAAAVSLPVLGICRGLQILAVAYGGTLASGLDHRLPDSGHEVHTAAGSLIHELLGPRAHTSALHRQAILDLGPGWRATAWADDDTIEAIEPSRSSWPVVGVQWHPELTSHPVLRDGTGPALFGWLVDQARRTGSSLPSTPPQGDISWTPSPLSA